MNFLVRWMKFNTVGLLGIGVQLAALWVLASGAGVHYLGATALAVETALLHNFLWHERWTWGERRDRRLRAVLGRLLRFHLGNGLVSLATNVALMRVFRGHFGLPVVPANLVCISLAGMANFLLGEFFVFRRVGKPGAEPA